MLQYKQLIIIANKYINLIYKLNFSRNRLQVFGLRFITHTHPPHSPDAANEAHGALVVLCLVRFRHPVPLCRVDLRAPSFHPPLLLNQCQITNGLLFSPQGGNIQFNPHTLSLNQGEGAAYRIICHWMDR